jgi:hypothetical protein
MVISPLGMVTEVREVQDENAQSPMDFVLLGIITEVRDPHDSNAQLPMKVALAGMLKGPDLPPGN